MLAGIINTIVYAFLIFDIWFFNNNDGKFATIGLGIIFAILFVFSVMNFFLWTLIITFDFTLKQAYKNSFKFVFINLKYNLLCVLVNILIFALNVAILFLAQSYWFFALLIELLLFVLLYPGFNALLIQYCTFPSIKKYIIDPYYAEHPDLDIEKRRALGIEVETKKKEKTENTDGQTEVEEEDSDVIFED